MPLKKPGTSSVLVYKKQDTSTALANQHPSYQNSQTTAALTAVASSSFCAESSPPDHPQCGSSNMMNLAIRTTLPHQDLPHHQHGLKNEHPKNRQTAQKVSLTRAAKRAELQTHARTTLSNKTGGLSLCDNPPRQKTRGKSHFKKPSRVTNQDSTRAES